MKVVRLFNSCSGNLKNKLKIPNESKIVLGFVGFGCAAGVLTMGISLDSTYKQNKNVKLPEVYEL